MITVAQVKETLAAVAAEQAGRGDARVARSLAPRYVEHGQPCCLVALVLHRRGFSIAQLKQLDTEPGTPGGGVEFGKSRHPLMRRIAPGARELLDFVQFHQDRGWDDWKTVADRALQRGRFDPGCPGHPVGFSAGRRSDRAFPWNEPAGDADPTVST